MPKADLKLVTPVPANPNSLENGLTDPTPEKGQQGSVWRSVISWLKGFGK